MGRAAMLFIGAGMVASAFARHEWLLAIHKLYHGLIRRDGVVSSMLGGERKKEQAEPDTLP
ncbi:hypothetical protein [Rhodanobacter glycinis]|uniref:hypothetical protein n=1 Tax=Rhodanobacter glycinis TaxID=582702 RepID=UPI0019601996|nr:hypothetical protein [Rhodanobacter glycinis]